MLSENELGAAVECTEARRSSPEGPPSERVKPKLGGLLASRPSSTGNKNLSKLCHRRALKGRWTADTVLRCGPPARLSALVAGPRDPRRPARFEWGPSWAAPVAGDAKLSPRSGLERKAPSVRAPHRGVSAHWSAALSSPLLRSAYEAFRLVIALGVVARPETCGYIPAAVSRADENAQS